MQRELAEVREYTTDATKIRSRYERKWVESVKPTPKEDLEEYLREVVRTISNDRLGRPVTRRLLARRMGTSVRRLNRVLPVLIDAGILEGSLTVHDSGLAVRPHSNLNKGISAAVAELTRPRRRHRVSYYPTHSITRVRYRNGLSNLKKWSDAKRSRIVLTLNGRSYDRVRERSRLLKQVKEKYREMRKELRRLAALADKWLRRHETDPELLLFGQKHPLWNIITGNAENSETPVL